MISLVPVRFMHDGLQVCLVLAVDYIKIRQSTWRDHVVAGLRSCSGATAIEYAIIAASIAVAIILAVNVLGVELSNVFEELAAVFERNCVQVGSNCDQSK